MNANLTKTEFNSSLTLNLLDTESLGQNRAYIITRKPAQQGRVKVHIGERYSREG